MEGDKKTNSYIVDKTIIDQINLVSLNIMKKMAKEFDKQCVNYQTSFREKTDEEVLFKKIVKEGFNESRLSNPTLS